LDRAGVIERGVGAARGVAGIIRRAELIHVVHPIREGEGVAGIADALAGVRIAAERLPKSVVVLRVLVSVLTMNLMPARARLLRTRWGVPLEKLMFWSKVRLI
jgi:hypothetical protein